MGWRVIRSVHRLLETNLLSAVDTAACAPACAIKPTFMPPLLGCAMFQCIMRLQLDRARVTWWPGESDMPKGAAVARVLIAILVVTLSSPALGVGADQPSGVQGASAPVGARMAPPDPAASGAEPTGRLFTDVASFIFPKLETWRNLRYTFSNPCAVSSCNVSATVLVVCHILVVF